MTDGHGERSQSSLEALTSEDFGELWATIQPDLRRTLRASSADIGTIEEICQDTAALAWERRGRFRGSETDLIRWAVVVARRLLWRRTGRNREQLTDPDTLAAVERGDPIDTERIVSARLQWERVNAAIPDLPPSERAAVMSRLLGLPPGTTKREQDANAAALARARKRLGRLGGLGPAWRWRRCGRPRSGLTRVGTAVASGLAAVAVVAVPVAVVATAFSGGAPQPAGYAQPIGYSQRDADLPGAERDEHRGRPSHGTSPRSDEQPDDELSCVATIVETLSAVDGAARWAEASRAVAEARAEMAALLPSVAAGLSTATRDSAMVAELEQRANQLLERLTTSQTKLVCRHVRRVSSSMPS